MAASGRPERVGGFRRWRCAVCGEDVVEGQRFAWIPGLGFVHFECISGLLASRGSLDAATAALLDASEAVSYAIVRLKAAERLAPEEVAGFIGGQRKRLEGVAAALENKLAARLREAGLLPGEGGGEGG